MIRSLLSILVCVYVTTTQAVPETSASVLKQYCTPEEAHAVARLFVFYNLDSSDCPSDFWLKELRIKSEQENEFRQKVLLYIGFNKGYGIASWLNTWTEGYSSASVSDGGTGSRSGTGSAWLQALTTVQGGAREAVADCGVCGDCRRALQPPQPPLTRSFNTTIVGIDLNPFNVDLVGNISKQFPHLVPPESTTLYLEHAAVSNKDGVVSVDNARGTSFEGLAIRPGREQDTEYEDYQVVRQVTVDTLVDELLGRGVLPSPPGAVGSRRKSAIHPNKAKLLAPLVDVLVVDAEGFDPLVLQGARALLRRREARIIVFEYHDLCPWPIYLLRTVLWHIERWEYVCYFQSQRRRLWRISGESLVAQCTAQCTAGTYFNMCIVCRLLGCAI